LLPKDRTAIVDALRSSNLINDPSGQQALTPTGTPLTGAQQAAAVVLRRWCTTPLPSEGANSLRVGLGHR
jgi:hypothetical protein